MNVLPLYRRVQIIAALVDGCSLRTTERLTHTDRKTIGRLLLSIGEGCRILHNRFMQRLQASIIEVDEIWAFVGKKEFRLQLTDPAEFGDAFTFVALDVNSRAVLSYLTGKRSPENARAFMVDLRARVLGRPQISTDGYRPYPEAIRAAFGDNVNYAQILKRYQPENPRDRVPVDDLPDPDSEGRVAYRSRVLSVTRIPRIGTPDELEINSVHIERNNLTSRMRMRRLTRKTNAYSKKLKFLKAAVALHFFHYNFCVVHGTTKETPAMGLGLANRPWTLEEMIVLALQAVEDAPPEMPVTPLMEVR